MSKNLNKQSTRPNEGPKNGPSSSLEKDSSIKSPDISRAALDTMALGDAAESTIGKVSETLSEGSEHDLGSGGGQTQGDNTKQTKAQDIEVIKAKLLEKAPTPAMMKKEIEKEIRKEIGYLHKRAMKMITSPGQIDYYEMNNLFKKLRELKGIVKALVQASVENIKTMWLRFVHGIM